MKKYAAKLSLIFLMIGASPFILGIYFDFFEQNLFFIAAIGYIAALLLALVAEKGTTKKIALIILNAIAIGMIVFFAVMAIFWSQA